MVNGEQGEGGGQRTYSEEDVMSLMNEAARRAASEAMKSANAQNAAQNAQNAQNAAQNAHAQNEQNIRNAQKAREEEDDAEVSVINPKVVRQLKDSGGVYSFKRFIIESSTKDNRRDSRRNGCFCCSKRICSERSSS